MKILEKKLICVSKVKLSSEKLILQHQKSKDRTKNLIFHHQHEQDPRLSLDSWGGPILVDDAFKSLQTNETRFGFYTTNQER